MGANGVVGHRPLTLQHGDLHPANAVVTKDGSGDGQSAALFDWAEINVSSGAAPTPPPFRLFFCLIDARDR